MGRFFFICFLDLSAAFDGTIREYVLGALRDDLSKDDFIKQVVANGLPPDAAGRLYEEAAACGSLLEDMEVPEAFVEAIRSLHLGSWFAVAAATSKVRTSKGGRQGCPLGAFLFNLAYARALYGIEQRLRAEGVCLQLPGLPMHNGPEIVLQATYVDDEAYMLEASSPAHLDAGMRFF